MSIVTQVSLLNQRRTKIIATIGPASSKPQTIRQLIQAGVNVFRLNMSHGNYDSHREAIQHIRTISKELNEVIAILADLGGPKIRTGKFSNNQITLTSDSQVIVTTRNVLGEDGLIPSQYQSLDADICRGDRILLSDGVMELRVDDINDTEIRCTVIHGGILKNHSGINLPGVRVSAPSLTEKDIKDAQFALGLGVDYLALSFVRCANDIEDLKKLIRDKKSTAAIIAKIEKPEALDDVNNILDVTDAIMVARGDLGVELQPEEVPVAQSQLIQRARQKFKPTIVATQMLESMINHARPTRAEVTDISNAVTQGADAVMLSAETAAGAYPVEAVKIMNRIIRQTEAHLWQSGAYASNVLTGQQPPIPIWDAMANAVNNMTHNLGAKAILVVSQSGMSVASMVSTRPAAPVVAITCNEQVCRRMALLWSVIPMLKEEAGRTNPNLLARQAALELKLAEKGKYVLLVRGFHSNNEMNTPTMTALMV